MNQDGGACDPVQPGEASNVINMGMCADYGANLQFVPLQNLGDALDLVARVHNDRFVRDGVAQDRAVALQHPDGDHFVDQFLGHRRPV